MAQAILYNHRGAEEVTRDELNLIEAPPPTDTWYPISHRDVNDAVQSTLQSAGYQITREQYSVAKEGHQFFGVLDLDSSITEGVTLAVGIRNSTNKSFPIGFACGNRVFCCDNMSFTSEIVVSKRHTRFGEERYLEGISKAVASLGQYQEQAAHWIGNLQARSLSREETDSIILRSYETGIIGARQLPEVIAEVRNPSMDEFRPANAWSLWNNFTSVLGRTKQSLHPAKAALTTIKLQGMFSEAL